MVQNGMECIKRNNIGGDLMSHSLRWRLGIDPREHINCESPVVVPGFKHVVVSIFVREFNPGCISM